MQTYQIIKSLVDPVFICRLSAEQLADAIREGGGVHGVYDYKAAIDDIRFGKHTLEEITALKQSTLPAFIPSEEWSGKRRTEGTKRFVMGLVLDVDGKDNPSLANFINQLDEHLPGTLVFNSPKNDCGRKLLFEVVFSTEDEYYIACELLKHSTNERVYNLVGLDLKFDPRNYLTNVCLLSYDPFVKYDPAFTLPLINFAANKHLLANKPKTQTFVFTTALSSIQTSANEQELFDNAIKQLQEREIDLSERSLDGFMTEICYLARFGVTIDELCKMVDDYMTQTNGGYKGGNRQRTALFSKIVRLVTKYHSRKVVVAPTSGNQNLTYHTYLTERLDLVVKKLKQHKTLYLAAPTGGGKTTLIKELAKHLGLKLDLYTPTTALADQQHDPVNGIYSLTGENLLGEAEINASVLACCYESIGKLSTNPYRRAKIAVFDEAHELATEYSYRYKTVHDIMRKTGNYDYVIYLSGTLYPVIENIVDNRRYSKTEYDTAVETSKIPENYLSFTPKQPRTISYDLVKPTTPDYNYFINTVCKNKLHVFYKQSTTVLQTIEQELTAQGYKCLLVSADNKSQVGYQEIINRSTLDGYDVLLTTSLLRAGVNVLDDRPTRIVFGKADMVDGDYSIGIVDYVQFAARWRNIIPVVEIVHDNTLQQIFTFNPSYVFNKSLLRVADLKADQRNKGGKLVNKFNKTYINNFGAFLNSQGNYEVSFRNLQDNRYMVNKSNVQRNVRELHNYLGQHSWQWSGKVNDAQATIEASGSYQKNRKQRKLRKEAFAEELILTSIIKPVLTKDERALLVKFNTLQCLLPRKLITAKMLTKKSEYQQWYNKGAFRVCRADVKNGYALKETVVEWFKKFSKIQKNVKADTTYTKAELETIMYAINPRYTDKGMKRDIDVVYGIKYAKRRIKGTADSERVYKIGKLHEYIPALSDQNNRDTYLDLLQQRVLAA